MTNCGEYGHAQGACGNASCSRGGFDCPKCGIGPGHMLPCVCKPAWAVTQAEQDAMSVDRWEAWKTALKVESETPCPHCGKPLINCKCWGEVRDDAERFRWLCLNPDWHFIELLCQEFVAEGSGEFYQGICAAIDKFRRVEESADSIRDRINAAMGGRQPVPWSAQQSRDDTTHE